MSGFERQVSAVLRIAHSLLPHVPEQPRVQEEVEIAISTAIQVLDGGMNSSYFVEDHAWSHLMSLVRPPLGVSIGDALDQKGRTYVRNDLLLRAIGQCPNTRRR